MNVIDNFFQSIQNLPVMPKVVQEVIQMLNNEDVDLNDLEKVIEHDQVISAKVLRLANSSYFGMSRAIRTIDDAIALIGLDNLRMIVVAHGVTSSFKAIPGFDLKRFWRHSLVSASIARQICRERKHNADTAYVSALMHSIGQLPIHIVFPNAGKDIDEMCRGLSVLERKAVENATLGLDHCQIGEELARRWNFPEEICKVIRYYATPLDKNASNLAPIVYLAAHIAFGLERGEEAKYIAETLNPDIAKLLEIVPEDWVERIESYKPYLSEAQTLL